MHKRLLIKPDGRALTLYAREPITGSAEPPSPITDLHRPDAHLRWHPMRGEWVAYATHRQQRTFLPPADYDPLSPTRPGHPQTELPQGNWEVAVFDNLFPALTSQAHTPPPHLAVPTARAHGVCEVVVFTQDAEASLGTLPLWHVELIVDVWADRYEVLRDRGRLAYVFPFENRGIEVGVTLTHPHGQIYAYPFVPPVAARELDLQRQHLEQSGRGLLEDVITREVEDGSRLVYAGDRAVAFMPIFARYPYEVWVAPRRPAASFAELGREERADFARALKTVLLKLDGLWGQACPYVLAFHQAPTDGLPHPEAHLHAEFYPAYRMRGRLKYLAGSELGAGVFTADTVPEDRVRELQAVEVDVDA